jgi:hypothetical protein
MRDLDQEDTPQIVYPGIFNITRLTIDKTLPLVKIKNMKHPFETPQEKLDIEVEIPPGIKKADLFLFINQIKKDMFYQVDSGSFIFKNVKSNKGKNYIELFYRIGEKRSSSVYCRFN